MQPWLRIAAVLVLATPLPAPGEEPSSTLRTSALAHAGAAPLPAVEAEADDETAERQPARDRGIDLRIRQGPPQPGFRQ
jgi:hypothetical protein